jgi:hypothetical protein
MVQISADLFQALGAPGGRCDADTMDWALIIVVLVHRHIVFRLLELFDGEY